MPCIRLDFSVEDLARVRIVPTLGPLAETMLALRMLRQGTRRALFDRWRRQSRHRLTPEAAVLTGALAPRGQIGFDLFSLVGRAESLEEGLERLVTVPYELLHLELKWLGEQHLKAEPLRDLDRDDLQARRAMADTLAACHRATVEPYWHGIRSWLEAEALSLGRLSTGNGLEALLSARYPALEWQPPVLQIATSQCQLDADVNLAGRGLTIVPAFFCAEAFCAAPVDGSAVLLFVPALPSFTAAMDIWSPPSRQPERDLSALLGATRAAVLSSAAPGRTTGEIARHLGISPAGASQHTSVLREAGLLVSRREHNNVIHTLTPAGRALLNG